MSTDNPEIKIMNGKDTEKLFLEPSDHFSPRLTVRRSYVETSWGRGILKKVKESGVKMTRNEKKLYEECFGKVIQLKNFRKGMSE